MFQFQNLLSNNIQNVKEKFSFTYTPQKNFSKKKKNVARGNLPIQIDLNQITGIIFGSSTRLEALTCFLVILVNSIFDDIIHPKKLG